MKTPFVPAVAGLAVLLMTNAAFAQNRTFTSQYSFGDSLSDSGNLYALTSRTQPPSPPYFNGHFSNGPTFVELLGNPIVPSATAAGRGTNRNFAFGGANAGAGGQVPNLAQQIGLYTQQGNAALPTDLFTVLAGANDLIATLSAPTTPFNPAALDAAGAAAAQSVAAGVQSLIGLGAKNIVVAGLPNLGATPRSLAAGGVGGPGSTFGLRATNAFNNELVTRLRSLGAGAPDVNLIYVDLQTFLDRVILDAAALGFTNTSSYVLAQPGASADSFVFFDDIHPTAKTHALLAGLVTEALNPEPQVGFSAATASAALALQGVGANAIGSRTSLLAMSNRATGRGDAYVMFNYADGNRARDGWRPKFGFTGKLVTAGADLRMSDGFFLGGAIDAGRLCTTVSGGGRFNVENGTGRVYGVWRGGPVALIVDGDFGVVRVKDIRRSTALGGAQTSAKASGDHWGAGVKAAWSVEAGALNFRPWAGLRTERVSLGGFTERDVAALTMTFDRQKVTSSAAAVGVDLSSNAHLGSRPARFDLRAAWHGEISSKLRTVSGRLADNIARSTALSFEEGDGDGFELGGAVTLSLNKAWSASVGYTADLRKDEQVMSRASFSLQTGY